MCDSIKNSHVFLWSGGDSNAKMPSGIPCMCGKMISKPLEDNYSNKDGYQVIINENFEAVGEAEEKQESDEILKIIEYVKKYWKEAATKTKFLPTDPRIKITMHVEIPIDLLENKEESKKE